MKYYSSQSPLHLKTGFSLFISLVLLFMLSLIALSVSKNVDNSQEITNNALLKNNTILMANLATDLASQWVISNQSILADDQPDQGYYASEQVGTDFFGSGTDSAKMVDWTGNGGLRKACRLTGTTTDPATGSTLPVCNTGASLVDPKTGNQISFIIQRMCDTNGLFVAGSAIKCATQQSAAAIAGSKAGASYGTYSLSGKSRIYYRITTQITSIKGIRTLSQSMVLLDF